MAEKFKKIVNAPHKAFGRARKKIAAMETKSKKGKTAKVAGVTVTGLLQFLLWATKYAALDNHATRATEKGFANMQVGKNKKGEDKKLSAFAKKYPDLSAHILYYMMMAGLIAGGNMALDNNKEVADEITDDLIENTVGIETENTAVYEEGTYGAYLAKLQPITPLLIADMVLPEGVCMNENGMHVVYDDANGNPLHPGDKAIGKPTIGFGSTKLKDGSRVTSNTKPITTEEAYETARHHLEVGETYFLMYCYETGVKNIKFDTTGKAIMVASMLYNMGSKLIEEANDENHIKRSQELRDLYAEYGFGVPDEMVRELFDKYPVTHPTSFGKSLMGIDKKVSISNRAGLYLKANGGLAGGLVWRRMLEAGFASGDINPVDILDVPVGGMSEFYQIMCKEVGGDKKKAFWTGNGENRRINKSIYKKFHEWRKNPVDKHGHSMAKNKKIKDVLPKDIVQICRSGQCYIGNKNIAFQPVEIAQTVKKDNVENKINLSVKESTYVIGYEQKYDAALKAFHNKNYADAATQFEKLIAEYPNNALVHNDLAVAYNKLGRYDDAIKHARIILHEIGDKSQYAAAQYNAGYAYEQKGDLQKALANYKLAVANGNRRVQKAVTRVSEKIQSNQKTRNKKSTKVAYANGVKKVRNNAHSADFDLQSALYDGRNNW